MGKYIESLQKNGPVSVRLVGGTSKNGKNAAFVIFKLKFLNEYYLLVIPYNDTYHLKEEVELIDEYESPRETAAREFFEEVGIRIRSDSKSLKLFDMIRVRSNLKKGAIHKKYFFRYIEEIPDFWDYSVLFEEREDETQTPFFIKESLISEFLYKEHYKAFKRNWRKRFN